MDYFDNQRQTRGAAFVFIALIFIFNLWIGSRYPIFTEWTATIMIIAGIPLFVYGLIISGKYRQVLDYEPTTLWGRQTNGKNARKNVSYLGIIGIGLFIIGIILRLFFS